MNAPRQGADSLGRAAAGSSVFERSGYRFARRKRVKTRIWSFGSDSIRTEALVGFARGGGAADGLAAERTGLVHRGFEIGLAVAKGDPALADRHAPIGFAVASTIHRDQLGGRALDLDHLVDQDLAATVHGDEIGRAIALAGDHDDAA